MSVGWKEGDTLPVINYTLTHADGDPIPLEGAQVWLVLQRRTRLDEPPIILEGVPLVPTDEEANYGIVKAVRVDTAVPAGTYRGEWKLYWSDPEKFTVPNDTHITVKVLKPKASWDGLPPAA